MSNHRRVKLSDVARIVTGATPSSKESDNWGSGAAFLTPSDMTGVDFKPTVSRRLTPKAESRLGTRLIAQKAVAVVCIGATIGKVAYISEPTITNQQINTLVPDSDVLDSLFCFYLLQPLRAELISIASGSATPILNKTAFSKVEVDLPALDEQRRISEILAALDELIEVNRRLVRDLDSSVGLLGLAVTASAQDRPRVPFTEISDVVKGYSYKSSELVPGDGWLVNLKNIGRSGTFEARGFKPLTASVKDHHYVENGDVLVAQTDLTQEHEVIARPVRLRRGNFEGSLVASLDLAIVRPRSPHTRESIFAILDTDDFRSHALGYCNGTTVLHMGARALPDYSAPSLSDEEIGALTDRVHPLREAADALNAEISLLESTRDELLPLLLSGRVRVELLGAA